MTTQILLTIRLDHDAEMRNPYPLPSSMVVMDEVNAALRSWEATNPLGLFNPSHMTLKLDWLDLPVSLTGYGPKLAGDLHRIAGDLTTLAHITENL